MSYTIKLSSLISSKIKRNRFTRLFYTVHHNEKRGLFYVKLDNDCKIYYLRNYYYNIYVFNYYSYFLFKKRKNERSSIFIVNINNILKYICFFYF